MYQQLNLDMEPIPEIEFQVKNGLPTHRIVHKDENGEPTHYVQLSASSMEAFDRIQKKEKRIAWVLKKVKTLTPPPADVVDKLLAGVEELCNNI